MSDAPEEIDEAEAMLARLARRDLSLAERVHECAMAATDAQEVCDLTRAYDRASRSLRQTLALHAKLRRERLADERAHPRPAPRTDWVRVRTRQNELRDAVCRVIWNETEADSDDEDVLLDILNKALNNGVRDPDFIARPLDAHVLDLCAVMNLPLDVAERWRDLPDLSDTRECEPESHWAALSDVDDHADDEDDEPPEPACEPAPAWRNTG